MIFWNFNFTFLLLPYTVITYYLDQYSRGSCLILIACLLYERNNGLSCRTCKYGQQNTYINHSHPWKEWKQSCVHMFFLSKKCKILCTFLYSIGKLTFWITKPWTCDSNLLTFTIWAHLCDIVIKNQIPSCLIKILLFVGTVLFDE